jgi:hypothetical protein
LLARPLNNALSRAVGVLSGFFKIPPFSSVPKGFKVWGDSERCSTGSRR